MEPIMSIASRVQRDMLLYLSCAKNIRRMLDMKRAWEIALTHSSTRIDVLARILENKYPAEL